MPLAAADVENWNGVELELVNTNRWQVRARGDVRSTDAFRRILQIRGVGDVRFSLARRLSLVGQFHLVEGRTGIGWDQANRLMGGFEVPVWGENRAFTARTLVEQMWLPRDQTYRRYRERFALRWTRVPLKPQLMAELMADSHGWAATRPSLTVLVPAAKYLDLDLGYHFEFRPRRLGGNRQMVYTYFRVHRRTH